MNKRLNVLIISFMSTLLLFSSAFSDEAQILFDDSEIPSFYITIPPDSLEWLLAEENLNNDRYLIADMEYVSSQIDTSIPNIGFRLRGNTSRNASKKSFKISMNTFEDKDFYGLKKINLNGEHNDPTISRSKLNWDLLNDTNQQAARCSHVKLYINDEYRGLYINVEEYNKTFLQDRFGNDNGNLYKCTYPADLTWLGNDPDLYKQEQWGRRFYELKTNEDEDDYTNLAHLIDVINNTSDEEFIDSLETYFNTWTFLKALASEVIMGHWDNYWYNKNNYFLYDNPQSGKFEYIPYDLDNSYGIWWDGIEPGRDWGTLDVYEWGNAHGEARPLVDRMLEEFQYRVLYSTFLYELSQDHFNNEEMDQGIYDLRDQISNAAEEDNFRTMDYGWSYQDFYNSFNSPLGQHVYYGLTDYVSTRVSSLSLGPGNVSNQAPVIPGHPQIYFSAEHNIIELAIQVFDDRGIDRVEMVNVEGTTETSFEMIADGIVNEGLVDLNNYILAYPVTEVGRMMEYYFRVVDEDGLEMTYPRFAPEETLSYYVSGFCINEFLASNDEINSDENGEFDDWVELYNYSESTVNLGGYFLTDDPGNQNKWMMPNVEIEAGEFLLIWTDDDEEQGELHTSFKLSADGEFVGVFRQNGADFDEVDGITFGPQETDISWGRSPDGGDEWGQMTPSPSASNNPLGIKDEEGNVPQDFALYPPYPNPFNSEVSIKYSLPRFANAEIRIVNIEGKTVEQWNIGSGNHLNRINWDASKHSSGIYFVQLVHHKKSCVKKIVLLK